MHWCCRKSCWWRFGYHSLDSCWCSSPCDSTSYAAWWSFWSIYLGAHCFWSEDAQPFACLSNPGRRFWNPWELAKSPNRTEELFALPYAPHLIVVWQTVVRLSRVKSFDLICQCLPVYAKLLWRFSKACPVLHGLHRFGHAIGTRVSIFPLHCLREGLKIVVRMTRCRRDLM